MMGVGTRLVCCIRCPHGLPLAVCDFRASGDWEKAVARMPSSSESMDTSCGLPGSDTTDEDCSSSLSYLGCSRV